MTQEANQNRCPPNECVPDRLGYCTVCRHEVMRDTDSDGNPIEPPEVDYYYPWTVDVFYGDGSQGNYEFRDKKTLKKFLRKGITWDAVKGVHVMHMPMVQGQAYKLDVKYQR